MSYFYINKSRLSRSGVQIPEADLDSLPKHIIDSALKQKVIKKNKSNKNE